MKYTINYEGNKIGELLTNHSMTTEEICEAAGVELARTQEDYENMPENGMYDLDDLEIVGEEW